MRCCKIKYNEKKIKLRIHSFSLYFLFYIHLYNVPLFSISLSSSTIVSIIWISEDFDDELVVEEELVVEILLVEETCSETWMFSTNRKHDFSKQTLLRKLYLYQICTKLYFKSLLFEKYFYKNPSISSIYYYFLLYKNEDFLVGGI